MNRDFKGIWIPREIWLMEDLSAQEKCLWAEIHSLFDRERGGCYASNEYLMGFVGVKERRLQEMIASLKEKGLIVQVSFNGRERVIKAVLPPEDFGACGAEVQESAPLGCGKVHLSDAESCTPLIYREKRIDKSIDNTHPNPQKGEPPDGGKPAKAGRVCESFGSHVKLTKEEHKALSDAYGESVIATIIEEMNDYCLASKPKGYSDYAAAIRQWMRKRADVAQKAKKERKFAPSSDDKKALAILQSMKENAL